MEDPAKQDATPTPQPINLSSQTYEMLRRLAYLRYTSPERYLDTLIEKAYGRAHAAAGLVDATSVNARVTGLSSAAVRDLRQSRKPGTPLMPAAQAAAKSGGLMAAAQAASKGDAS